MKQAFLRLKPYYNSHFHRFRKGPCFLGRCNICGRATVFFCESDDRNHFRESLVCGECLTTSRYRSIARGILRGIKELTGVEAKSVSELASKVCDTTVRIYETQIPVYFLANAYPIPDLLVKCCWIELLTSVYKPMVQWGSYFGGNTTNQNIEAITYGDNGFDMVITSDVMERVRLDRMPTSRSEGC